ncbi:VOC family protein [Granulicoccus phenolivorans]|uniref:VOC family protein n=1 Tax=Granulicoccus phenolivorans TaxID=266854 RepID=UPI00041AC70F|nr:VOC family protein [Granulicoccus phenolivorans]
MITVDDLAYVRIGTQDLDTQIEFVQRIVGLELMERTETTAHFRSDDRYQSVIFEQGEPRSLASAFQLRDQAALDAAAEHLRSQGLEVTAGTAEDCALRHVRGMISFVSPGNNVVELVTGMTQVVSRPVRFTRPAGITEFGHLGLEVPDVEAGQRFWSDNFGFLISDWIGDRACLMRFDPVHHKLALFNEATGLGHVNFQVGSFDDIMRSWNFLKKQGVKIQMGPGRHPQSTAIFLYFYGPEDVTWEYSFGVREIHGEWTPRRFDPTLPDFIDMWQGALTDGPTWSEDHA